MMQALFSAILVGIELLIFPDTLRNFGHVGDSVSNPLSYFGVKRGGASDSGTEVDEAVDRFKCMVLDGERGGNISTLSHDFGFC